MSTCWADARFTGHPVEKSPPMAGKEEKKMNMFGNLGKMGEMMKQAKRLKDEISRSRYEGEDSGIRVVINGELEITELKIPQDITGNRLENPLRNVINRTLKNAKNDMAQKMQKITGGLNLPGM